MSVISLIKLIIIGAGMIYYYRLMDENNDYYISFPVIGGFIVCLGLSFTLDPVAANIFLFMLNIFLYFVFTFMAQTDTVVSVSYIAINILANIGKELGILGANIPIGVLVVISAIYWILRYIDIDFLIAIIKWQIITVILGVIWTMGYEQVMAYLLTNHSTLPI